MTPRQVTSNLTRLLEAFLEKPSIPKWEALGKALLQKHGKGGRLTRGSVMALMEQVLGVRGEAIPSDVRQEGKAAILQLIEEGIKRELGLYHIVLAVPGLRVTQALTVGGVRLLSPEELEHSVVFRKEAQDETGLSFIAARSECFAELEAQGDASNAFAEARRVVRETWPTLYFCAHKYGVGKKWVGGPVSAWYVRDDGQTGAFGGGIRQVGLDPLAPDDVEKMRSAGFATIEEVLRASPWKRTDLQERLLKASGWWVRGDLESHAGIALVCFVTAMETVVMTERASEGRRTLAQRVACLISQDPSERARAFEECDAVVRARHRVVHSGEREVRVKALASAARLAFKVASVGWDEIVSGRFESGRQLAAHLDGEILK